MRILNEKNIKKTRDSNLELLRIVAMLLIVLLHLLSKGEILVNVEPFSFNYYGVWFLESAAFVSVNCYILISGYFFLSAKFTVRKFVRLWMEVVFWAFIIFYISYFTGMTPSLTFREVLRTIFPVISQKYWFVSAYFAVLLFAPIMQRKIRKLEKSQMKKIIVIGALALTIGPFLNISHYPKIINIIWFYYLFLVASYMQLNINPFKYKKISIMVYFVFTLALLATRVYNDFYANSYSLKDGFGVFFEYNSFFVFIASVGLFNFFRGIQLENRKINEIVLKIAPLTFAVYLIHEHWAIRQWIWTEEFIGRFFYKDLQSFALFFEIIIICISLFLICVLLEFFHRKLMKKEQYKEIETWLEEKVLKVIETARNLKL